MATFSIICFAIENKVVKYKINSRYIVQYVTYYIIYKLKFFKNKVLTVTLLIYGK